MKRTYWLVLTALVIASLVLPACGPKPAATEAPLTVVVGTDATWPPFENTDEQGNIVGFDIDLMNAIAAEEGFQVQFVNVAWDSLLAGMATCQYDAAISAMTITEERKQSFDFSDPYFAAGQVVAVRIDDTTINSKDDLSGKTIGVQLGTTGDIEAQKIAGATVKSYDGIALAFQDLLNGQVDAVIADNPLAVGYVGVNPDKLKIVGEAFTDEYYGIAVCKNKPELVTLFNEGLAKVEAKGVIDELTTKWLVNNGQ